MIAYWRIVRAEWRLSPEYTMIIRAQLNQIDLYRLGVFDPRWAYYTEHKELYFVFNNLRE